MLAPEIKDTSNMIQSPMPGVLISVSVADGQVGTAFCAVGANVALSLHNAAQIIQAGQEVAVVEAMKMQNVLRAPRAGIVKKVHAKAGQSLVVDQLIAMLVEPEAKSAKIAK